MVNLNPLAKQAIAYLESTELVESGLVFRMVTDLKTEDPVGLNHFIFHAFRKFNPLVVSILNHHGLLSLHDNGNKTVRHHCILGIIMGLSDMVNEDRIDIRLQALNTHLDKFSSTPDQAQDIIMMAMATGNMDVYRVVRSYIRPNAFMVTLLEKKFLANQVANPIGVASVLTEARYDALESGIYNLN